MAFKRELGQGFMVVPVASGKHISTRNLDAITFVIYEDGGATSIAFKQSKAGLNEKTLPVVNDYYSGDGVGSVLTHEVADANGALDDDHTLIKKDTTPFDAAFITIGCDALDLANGFDSIECTVDGGQCFAVLHGLKVQRAPQNLSSYVA
jgi:hypothetical protein